MNDNPPPAGTLSWPPHSTPVDLRRDADERRRPLRIVLVVKTNEGAMWVIPQVTELRRRGHTVIAILPAGTGRLTASLRERQVEVVPSSWDFSFRPGISTVRGLLQLRTLIRSLRPDVVKYHLYASALAARVSTIGMRLHRVHVVAGPLYLESPLVRPVERLLWRMDTVTICGTEFTSTLYGRLGCPPRRRPVATCGVDTDRFDPAGGLGAHGAIPPERRYRAELQAKARAELGIPDGCFVVVMVAYVYPPRRLVHRGRGIKGHDVLLTAWRTFQANHPRAHLLLVGGGWGADGSTHRAYLIGRFGVNDDPTITWLGSVPDVRSCYLAADVSVSPSLSEGHGAAVEAGAMGVPSIVSDAGGLPETVDGRCGWLVHRGDPRALADALTDAYHVHRAGQLVTRGALARRRIVDLFDNRRAARRVADLVEQCARRAVAGTCEGPRIAAGPTSGRGGPVGANNLGWLSS